MYKIVIIEDQEVTRNNLSSYLSRKNFEVFAASNGTDGINLILTSKPDIVLCDILLPDINGFSILSTIRTNKAIGKVPFLFLTACNEMKDLREGMNLGADDYITKPYNPSELLQVLLTRIELNKNRNTPHFINEDTQIEKFDYDDSFFIAGSQSYNSILVKDIKIIKADNTSSIITLTENRKIYSNKLLKFWEGKLPEKYFIRIHKSYIINFNYIEKIEKWFNNNIRIHIKNYSEPIESSRRYSAIIKQRYIV